MSMQQYEHVTRRLIKLNDEELENLIHLIKGIQDIRKVEKTKAIQETEAAASNQPGEKSASGTKRRKNGNRTGAWNELKRIRGSGPYWYRRAWEGGRLTSTYLGKETPSQL
jgi:hypothetical protein